MDHLRQVQSPSSASRLMLVLCLMLLLATLAATQHSPCVFQRGASERTLAANPESVVVEAWGRDSLRVRVSFNGARVRDDLPSALVKPPPARAEQSTSSLECHRSPRDDVGGGYVVNGNLRADVSPGEGLITFTRQDDGEVVLEEIQRTSAPSTWFDGLKNLSKIGQIFASSSSERIFGFGEHENGHLNQKGLEYDFANCTNYALSHGGEICLPYVTGSYARAASREDGSTPVSLDYGFLWNMPGFGTVSFNENSTEWTAIAAAQLDYLVTVPAAHSAGMQRNKDISSHYVDATGHSPILPEWAAGYWHSKLRYSSQAELLAAAQEFHKRHIPVDIIVIDFFNWAVMGDFTFDPSAWPDPKAMVDACKRLGMNIMVSVFPFIAPTSTSFPTINASNFEVDNGTHGDPMIWDTFTCRSQCYLYDPTNPRARQYVWSQIKKGYFDYGIDVFWLDGSEPVNKGYPDSTYYSVGPAEQVGMAFPLFHSQTVHDGLVAQGKPPIMLLRSAWAGQQRHGSAVWNGDMKSTFEVLERAIRAGLNIQLSGIAWWTTDVGGFSGGRPSDAEFRELVTRWFQYGCTCPLLRQHGHRDTEPWLLGNESYAIIVDIIRMRSAWREYVMDAMTQVSNTGMPVQRPLWYDFPDDPRAWDVEDQYLFGSQLLAAPVYTYQARERTLYLPAGSNWTHYYTSKEYSGGQKVTVAAPLDQFPLFKRSSGAAWRRHVAIPSLAAVKAAQSEESAG